MGPDELRMVHGAQGRMAQPSPGAESVENGRRVDRAGDEAPSTRSVLDTPRREVERVEFDADKRYKPIGELFGKENSQKMASRLISEVVDVTLVLAVYSARGPRGREKGPLKIAGTRSWSFHRNRIYYTM